MTKPFKLYYPLKPLTVKQMVRKYKLTTTDMKEVRAIVDEVLKKRQ